MKLCNGNRFATSERQWIEAQVENAKQQAILSMLKSQVSSDEAHIHRDIHSLRYVYTWIIDISILVW
jgi:HAUS augmin-like complex subunit 3